MERKSPEPPKLPDPPEIGKRYEAMDFLDAAEANGLTILQGSGVWKNIGEDKWVFAVILVPKDIQVLTEDTDGQKKGDD